MRTNCGGDHSDWEYTTFITPSACDVPIDLESASITENSATLNWIGHQDSYTVRYRPVAKSSFKQVGTNRTATATLTTYTFDLSAYSGQGSVAIRHYNVSDMFRLNVDDINITDAGGNTVLSEDFESGTIPAGWTNLDNDGDGYIWFTFHNGTDGNGNPYGNGDYFATSASYQGGILYPDNWLIIPGVELGGTLTFVARGQDPDYSGEVFGVYVATEVVGEWTEVNNVTGHTLNISGLSDGAEYEWQVQGSDCDGNGTPTAWSNMDYFTTVTTNPCPIISYTFETNPAGDWEFANGNLTNKWFWGTNVNHGGTHSIYISNNNGNNNNYTSNRNAMVYAYKNLHLDGGTYQFSYDWRARGENGYDFLRVALVPSNVTIVGSADAPAGFGSQSLPVGWMALDGGSQLNQVTSWQSRAVVKFVSAGDYKLVFAWRNNNSQGNNTAAAVDNVVVAKLNPLPRPFITATANPICSGSPATLQTGSMYDTFEWYKDDSATPISGATSYEYTTPDLSTETDYKVTVTDGDGCEATSSPFTVTVNRIDATIQIGD